MAITVTFSIFIIIMSNELLRLYFHRMRSKQSLLTDPYITHILLHQHRYNTLLFIFWKQQICVLKFLRSHCFLKKKNKKATNLQSLRSATHHIFYQPILAPAQLIVIVTLFTRLIISLN